MLEKLIEVSRQRNQKINKIEQIKPNRSVDEAMEKLKEYAATGYDSIEKDDKAVFFKYFGIFNLGKQIAHWGILDLIFKIYKCQCLFY